MLGIKIIKICRPIILHDVMVWNYNHLDTHNRAVRVRRLKWIIIMFPLQEPFHSQPKSRVSPGQIIRWLEEQSTLVTHGTFLVGWRSGGLSKIKLSTQGLSNDHMLKLDFHIRTPRGSQVLSASFNKNSSISLYGCVEDKLKPYFNNDKQYYPFPFLGLNICLQKVLLEFFKLLNKAL